VKLRLPADQRFTCRQCGLCCRGAAVILTAAEVERFRATGVARLHDGGGDPFDPAPHGRFTIRMRADGACGFLTERDTCRIHEERGAQAKPLACRVFPFRFHPVEGRPLVTTSASCPTIVANAGESLAAQAPVIAALRAEWARAFPEPDRPLALAKGRPIALATLASLQGFLREMLDREPEDPAAGIERAARWLEDLTRHRVLRLPPAAFAEYVALTGRHAASVAPAPPPRGPSAVTRLLARGFLFTVIAVREQADPARRGWMRRLRQLAHLHGLAPATAEVDRAAVAAAPLDVADAEVRRLLAHALRSLVDGLGTGRRPVGDEIGVGAATIAAGLAIAAMDAHRAGERRVGPARLAAGLSAAAAIDHADTGALAALLPALAGGVDALRLVADRARPAAQRPAGDAADR
jgi:lysine-N-methylase